MLEKLKVLETPKIDFIDLKAQQKYIRRNIDEAIRNVLNHGQYIMGPEVHQLEKELSEFCGAKHTVSCSSGTDALTLFLLAKDIGPGDAVFVPSMTFASSAEVVALVGAHPVFVDVLESNFNMDPESLKIGIKVAKENGLKPKGVMAVDLFGQPADYNEIEAITKENDLWLLCDSAQSFGAEHLDQKIGMIGDATTTSFFPAKPLGCYGDGGAVFTEDSELHEKLVSLRIHGQNKQDKYNNIHIGINGRMDTIQAAVLLEKLKIFPDELTARDRAASLYNEALKDHVQTPHIDEGKKSAWAQYSILLPENASRDKVIEKLKSEGVPTAIYYPIPLHQQKAYEQYLSASKSLDVSEKISKSIMSLPMHPYLTADLIEFISDKVIKAL